jgi:hypothetical protein
MQMAQQMQMALMQMIQQMQMALMQMIQIRIGPSPTEMAQI